MIAMSSPVELAVAVVLTTALIALLWVAFFSRRARQRRHQRGGYGRLRDHRQGPAVQLNLKVGDDAGG